ncbi:hypothetical protein [Pseudanabaena sp. FACHB-2040]|uniref:hypothetical protein n=1 Tax=Pseudanabaena sp. FACHB-2040 TaxID=2692859 RepID=UPI001685B759|nr:hypothetical protein [Pseudanabaena sp. FACHB-2040]MBD2256666.1 hypothetical protein [Pseudanabaena sp. FACHB-2040]
MKIEFVNDWTKTYMARKGPSKVFGFDVDTRESLDSGQATEHFDKIWEDSLSSLVKHGLPCSPESVRMRLSESASGRVKDSCEHREIKVNGCLFIAQLRTSNECDELWYVSSSSPDPRTLYITFDTVVERKAFEKIADSLGLDDKELGLELVRDFMNKFRNRKLP